MYNKYSNKRIRRKSLRTKKYKTRRYKKNKRGGIYGIRPRPTTAVHKGTEIPHYHLNVLLPSGQNISLDTSFGITHFLEEENEQFYSDYVANLLQTIEDKSRSNNITLFWRGKMLLPSMKLRRINVDGHFIDLSELEMDWNLTSKYTNQLTREDFENIAYEHVPEEGSTEYRDKPDTPREHKGEHVSSYDDQLLAKFNGKIEERMRQLGI